MREVRITGFVCALTLLFSVGSVYAESDLCAKLPKLGIYIKYADTCERLRMPLPGTPDPDSFELRRRAKLDKDVKLMADIVMPKGDASDSDKRYPAVIFINSWALEGGIEYLGAARKMAKNGYIVLMYTTRGMWTSGGHVDIASKEDIQDAQKVISWLLENAPVDKDNIGMAGISYGSGISLMTLAQDPRVKTVVAMSTWGMLGDELYRQETTALTWLEILLKSSWVSGNKMTQTTWDIAVDLKDPDISQERIGEVLDYAKSRSPGHPDVIAKINARGAPVMISKNYHDDLFPPNSSMKMFHSLTGPKKLLLNEGIHAMAEITGALGFKNFVFDKVFDWFDFWLKGEPGNNIMDPQERVIMELQGSQRGMRESYVDWSDSAVFNKRVFYMAPRGSDSSGLLQDDANLTAGLDTIRSGWFDTTATSGGVGNGDSYLGILSSVLTEQVIKSPVNWLSSVPKNFGVIYKSSPVDETLKIRGMPNLELWVKPHKSQAQVVAYLYDTSPKGLGTLITHGVRTLRWAAAQEEVSVKIEMNMAAYDLPPGHHLSLVIDTQDVLYLEAVDDWNNFSVSFPFGEETQSILQVPVVD
jgi:predicted acyl esterase